MSYNDDLEPKHLRSVFLTFIDLDLRGSWKKVYDKDHLDSFSDAAEIWLVSPDGLKRAWVMKSGSRVRVIGSTINFDPNDVVEEIVIDEKEQGNRSVVLPEDKPLECFEVFAAG